MATSYPAQNAAQLAASLLKAWLAGDEQEVQRELDSASGPAIDNPASTTLEDERRELLEGIAWAMRRHGPRSSEMLVCVKFLNHLGRG